MNDECPCSISDAHLGCAWNKCECVFRLNPSVKSVYMPLMWLFHNGIIQSGLAILRFLVMSSNFALIFTSSRYVPFLDWSKKDFSVSGIVGYLSSLIWNQAILATFFAYFLSSERIHSQDILYLICCPAHLREQVIQELERKDATFRDVSSRKKMIPGHDKAFVFVSGGISPVNAEDMEDFHLL